MTFIHGLKQEIFSWLKIFWPRLNIWKHQICGYFWNMSEHKIFLKKSCQDWNQSPGLNTLSHDLSQSEYISRSGLFPYWNCSCLRVGGGGSKKCKWRWNCNYFFFFFLWTMNKFEITCSLEDKFTMAMPFISDQSQLQYGICRTVKTYFC